MREKSQKELDREKQKRPICSVPCLNDRFCLLRLWFRCIFQAELRLCLPRSPNAKDQPTDTQSATVSIASMNRSDVD